MSSLGRHVLLLADGLVHGDRFSTGAARCVFESARVLAGPFRVTVVASADGDFGWRELSEHARLLRCPRSSDEQLRAIARVHAEAPVAAVMAFLDQTLPLASGVSACCDGAPLVYWMQVEPGPMHPMSGLESEQSRLDAVFLLSEHQQRSLCELHPGLRGRTHVVGIGIRASDPGELAPPRDGAAGRVSFVGRLSFAKGYDVFLAAVQHLEERGLECRFHTVGELDGDLPPIALQRRNRLLCTGRLRETPYAPPRELLREMAASDVLVLPSRTDCVPISILEAWHLGLPVVASAIPSLLELDGGRGVLRFPAGYSGAAFADSIAEVLGDAELARRTATAARALARERFSDAALRANLVPLMDALLRQKLLVTP